MERDIVVIKEKIYQEIKKEMDKEDDYFNLREVTDLQIFTEVLMQFLMQRHEYF